MQNVTIPRLQEIKYLGVKLEHTLHWNSQTQHWLCGRKGRWQRRIHLPHQTTIIGSFERQSIPVTSKTDYRVLLMVWGSSLTATQNNTNNNHKTRTTSLISNLEWETLNKRKGRRCLGIARARPLHFNEVATNINDFLTPFTLTIGYSRQTFPQISILHAYNSQ